MEQLVQGKIYSASKNPAPLLKLSPLFLIVGITLIGFAVISVVTRTLAQFTVPPPNPFTAYADIFPGQPESAVGVPAFLCQVRPLYSIPTQDNSEVYCTATPATGAFLMIRVIISQGIIRQTDFLIRDNTFRIGDLEALLGTAYFKAKSCDIAFARLGSIGLAPTLSGMKHYSLFRPVWNITFTDSGLT